MIQKAKSDNADVFRNFATTIGAIPLTCDVHGYLFYLQIPHFIYRFRAEKIMQISLHIHAARNPACLSQFECSDCCATLHSGGRQERKASSRRVRIARAASHSLPRSLRALPRPHRPDSLAAESAMIPSASAPPHQTQQAPPPAQVRPPPSSPPFLSRPVFSAASR